MEKCPDIMEEGLKLVVFTKQIIIRVVKSR